MPTGCILSRNKWYRRRQSSWTITIRRACKWYGRFRFRRRLRYAEIAMLCHEMTRAMIRLYCSPATGVCWLNFIPYQLHGRHWSRFYLIWSLFLRYQIFRKRTGIHPGRSTTVTMSICLEARKLSPLDHYVAGHERAARAQMRIYQYAFGITINFHTEDKPAHAISSRMTAALPFRLSDKQWMASATHELHQQATSYHLPPIEKSSKWPREMTILPSMAEDEAIEQ